MAPVSAIMRIARQVADLTAHCIGNASIERTARLSPEWGRLESKTPQIHHK